MMQQIGEKRALYDIGDIVRIGLESKVAGYEIVVDGETEVESFQTKPRF
jgi:hypothetical protein